MEESIRLIGLKYEHTSVCFRHFYKMKKKNKRLIATAYLLIRAKNPCRKRFTFKEIRAVIRSAVVRDGDLE